MLENVKQKGENNSYLTLFQDISLFLDFFNLFLKWKGLLLYNIFFYGISYFDLFETHFKVKNMLTFT